MKLYNLFPLLAGKFSDWDSHIERASSMGFNWVFVNPVQKPGASGSLYSISDYFQLNPKLVSKNTRKKPDTQLKEIIKRSEARYGIRMMTDLVINHCAIDSEILKHHPEWFVHDSHGNVEHPFCMEDGQKVVWYDLARFNHEHTSDPEGLYRFFYKIVDHYVNLGFKGFRCDAAYQIPANLWHRLIHDIKKKYPNIVFTAETLGCTEEQSRQTAQAGFDYIFNSSKWWDFSSSWLLDQHRQIRESVPSISFPESHDTERLFQESSNNVEALKQRYLFAAVFSTGVMMPMGYEYGFKKALHVVHTKPEDWESTDVDITDFIRGVNAFKSSYKVFQEEGRVDVMNDHWNPVLFLKKTANSSQEEALIILNKDPWNKNHFAAENLYQFLQSGKPLKDLSLEYPQDYIPTPYEFGLNPGMARVMVSA